MTFIPHSFSDFPAPVFRTGYGLGSGSHWNITFYLHFYDRPLEDFAWSEADMFLDIFSVYEFLV